MTFPWNHHSVARLAADPLRMTWPQYQRRECTFKNTTVRLSPTQREILATLLMRRGQLVRRDELIEAVYPDPDKEPETSYLVVDRMMWLLRRKLPGAIERIWGRGFLIPIPD